MPHVSILRRGIAQSLLLLLLLVCWLHAVRCPLTAIPRNTGRATNKIPSTTVIPSGVFTPDFTPHQ